MNNKPVQKLRSITLTSGSVKNLDADLEQLNIRGSVSLYPEIRLQIISTHGYSSFHSCVEAHSLQSSGSCKIKNICKINEITNAGNLKMQKGLVTKISSSGKLTIEQQLQAECIDAVGIVRALDIQAKYFNFKLSSESFIEYLMADEIYVDKDVLSFSFLRKRLNCKSIKGKNVHLSYTVAESVEGDVVSIGTKCTIKTLYYKEHYSISPSAKVQQIIKREKA